MHVRVTTEANYKAWCCSRVSGLAAQPLAEAECEPVEQLEPGDEAEAEEEAEQTWTQQPIRGQYWVVGANRRTVLPPICEMKSIAVIRSERWNWNMVGSWNNVNHLSWFKFKYQVTWKKK